jgi:PAS domain S-box-containing protein
VRMRPSLSLARESNSNSDVPTDFDSVVQEIRNQLQSLPSRMDRISHVIESVAEAVLVADDAGYYVAANQRAAFLTGYSSDDLLRRSVGDLTVPGESPVSERLWDSFLRTETQRGRYDLRRQDGSVVQVEYRAYANVIPGMHVSFLRLHS